MKGKPGSASDLICNLDDTLVYNNFLIRKNAGIH